MTQSPELVQPGCEESWSSMLNAANSKKEGGCKPGEAHLPPLGHFHLRILSQQSIPPAEAGHMGFDCQRCPSLAQPAAVCHVQVT